MIDRSSNSVDDIGEAVECQAEKSVLRANLYLSSPLVLLFVLPLLIIVSQVMSQARNFPRTFRVTEVLVATALIATALATLGPWGIIVVGIAFITWVSIACASTRGGRWTCLLI